MGLAISLQDLVVPSVRAAKWTVGENARQRGCSTRGNASYRFRLASFMHIHAGPAANPTRTTGHGAAFVAWSYTLAFTRTPTIPPPPLSTTGLLPSPFLSSPLSILRSALSRRRFITDHGLKKEWTEFSSSFSIGVFFRRIDVLELRFLAEFWSKIGGRFQARGFVWRRKEKLAGTIFVSIYHLHVQRTIGNVNEADKHPPRHGFLGNYRGSQVLPTDQAEPFVEEVDEWPRVWRLRIRRGLKRGREGEIKSKTPLRSRRMSLFQRCQRDLRTLQHVRQPTNTGFQPGSLVTLLRLVPELCFRG